MPGPEGEYAFEMLGRYYKSGEEPPYSGALEMLVYGSPAEQDTAGRYILALFAQSLSDETNGRGPAYPTPFFGGEFEYPAHEFRTQLSDDFASNASGPAALPICRWLLEKETDPEIAASAMPVMKRGNPPVSMLEKILDEPHPNLAILTQAVSIYAERADSASVQRHIEPLAHHLSADVREAVASQLEELKIAVPAFDPARGLSEPLRSALESLRDRVFPAIPAGSEWALFRWAGRYPIADTSNVPSRRAAGWIVSENDSIWWVVDEFGWYRPMPRNCVHREPHTLAAEAEYLSQVSDDLWDEHDGLLASPWDYMDQTGLDLACDLVASWCLERGDFSSAGRAMTRAIGRKLTVQPLLENPAEDLRYVQGEMLLRLMHYAPRDTLLPRLLEHLVRSYPDSRFAATHEELLAQYQSGDPRLFAAPPDSSEWDRARASMSREDLITWLMARLPLDTAFGTCDARAPRWPEGILDAAGPPVNPTVSDIVARPVLLPSCALWNLKLTVDDIPAVAPFLEDRTWRVYVKSMGTGSRPADYTLDLQRIQEEAADLINAAARQNLVNIDSLKTLDGSHCRDYAQSIERWAVERSGVSDAEVRLEVLRTTTDQPDFVRTMDYLVHQKNDSAGPVILKRFDEFPQIQDHMLQSLAALKTVEALPLAREVMRNPEQWSRKFSHSYGLHEHKHDTLVSGALRIVLRHGDHQAHEGFDAVEAFLGRQREPLFWASKMIDDMFASDSARSVSELCLLFDGSNPNFEGVTYANFCRMLIDGRCVKVIDFLIRLLAAADSVAVPPPGHYANEHRTATDVVRMVVQWSGEKIAFDGNGDVQPAAWEKARRWLLKQKARLAAGEPAELK